MSSITLHDVARLADVSIKTVSRVLNNEPYVSKAKRLRVEAAVEQLNYRPNMAARTLSGSKSYLLGFLGPTGAPMYIDRLLRGALEGCKKNNHHLIAEIYDTQADDVLQHVITLCSSTALDGVLLAPGLCDSPRVLSYLRERGIPHVGISPSEAIDAPYVHIDETGAAYAMTRHLLELGHERIAFLGYQPNWKFVERRLQGFRMAMQEAGISVPAGYIGEAWFTFRFGQERAEKLLALKEPPTALVAVNDETAVGAMVAAYRRGLAVPQDVSIVGFDDSPLAALTWPQLTTVRQPLEAMATAGVELILKPRSLEASEPSGLLLPFELIIRDTTGKPRRGSDPSRQAVVSGENHDGGVRIRRRPGRASNHDGQGAVIVFSIRQELDGAEAMNKPDLLRHSLFSLLIASAAQVAIAVDIPASDHAHAEKAPDAHVACVPVSERAGRKLGCFVVGSMALGQLPDAPMYWHIYEYPARAAAESAKGESGKVVDAFGKVWLFAIADAKWTL